MAFVLAYTRFVCEGACAWANMWAGGCAGVEEAKFLGDGGSGGKGDTRAFVNANFRRFSQSASQATVAKR